MSEKLFSDYPQIRARIADELRFQRAIIRQIYTYELPYQRRFRLSNFRDAYIQGIITGLSCTPKTSAPELHRKKRVR